MRRQGLAVVLSMVVVTSSSGAQTPAPGVATDPRLTPVPATPSIAPGNAPWLRIDPSKRQYYVYKSFAPPDLAARLDRPIEDAAYRALLSKRTAALRSGTRTLRLTINADSIIDVGSERLEEANTVAAIDLEKSPELLQMVRNDLKADPKTSYVMPFLNSMYVSSGAEQGYRVYDELVVSVVPKDLSQVFVWKLSDGRWQRLQQLAARAVPPPDRRTVIKQVESLRARPYYDGYMQVVIATSQMLTPGISSATLAELQEIKRKKEANEQIKETAALTYTAYGKGLCHHYCSAASCNGCCNNVSNAAYQNIVLLAIGCHFASDLCPWCHFGCAANTAMLTSIATNQKLGCMASCATPYEAPQNQGNPRGCSVH